MSAITISECPICGHILEEEIYTEEIWGSFDVVEVHQKCNRCKLYKYDYTYGVVGRKIGKRIFKDDKQHKFYIGLIRFLYKLGVINK